MAVTGNSDGPVRYLASSDRTITELIDKRSVHRFTSTVKKGDPLNSWDSLWKKADQQNFVPLWNQYDAKN
jgi:hypothetical protein